MWYVIQVPCLVGSAEIAVYRKASVAGDLGKAANRMAPCRPRMRPVRSPEAPSRAPRPLPRSRRAQKRWLSPAENRRKRTLGALLVPPRQPPKRNLAAVHRYRLTQAKLLRLQVQGSSSIWPALTDFLHEIRAWIARVGGGQPL